MQPGLQQKLIALEFPFLQRQIWCQKTADVGNTSFHFQKDKREKAWENPNPTQNPRFYHGSCPRIWTKCSKTTQKNKNNGQLCRLGRDRECPFPSPTRYIREREGNVWLNLSTQRDKSYHCNSKDKVWQWKRKEQVNQTLSICNWSHSVEGPKRQGFALGPSVSLMLKEKRQRQTLSTGSLPNWLPQLELGQTEARGLALHPSPTKAAGAPVLGLCFVAFPGTGTESWWASAAARTRISIFIREVGIPGNQQLNLTHHKNHPFITDS